MTKNLASFPPSLLLAAVVAVIAWAHDVTCVNAGRHYQSLACDSFLAKQRAGPTLLLDVHGSSRCLTVTQCLSHVHSHHGDTDTPLSPWMVVADHSDDTRHLRGYFLTFTSSAARGNVTKEFLRDTADTSASCHVFFTAGGSCLESMRLGWTSSDTVVWSSQLDTWVSCDNAKDSGGWTVIQRRRDESVNFTRKWEDYKRGFGSLAGSLWLGLENMRRLLASGQYRLRFDMVFKGKTYHALYDLFDIDEESQRYRLTVGSHSGTVGDSFSYHNGGLFQTVDYFTGPRNCPLEFKGGWWYKNCHECNANGIIGATAYGQGLTWHSLTGNYNSLDYIEMKVWPLL